MSPPNDTTSDREVQNQTKSTDQSSSHTDRERLAPAPAQLRTIEQNASFAKHLWQWTGLGEKTLLDLLQIVVAIAAAIAIPFVLNNINQQQEKTNEENRRQQEKTNEENRQREIEIAYDNQRHQILSSYLDQMTKFLLEDKLDASNVNTKIELLARARTLNTLTQLDGNRKGQVLKFLYEAQLIGGQCRIDLKDLKAQDCRGSILKLEDAKLDETKFERPIPLQGIDLAQASLAGAELSGIDLTRAKMREVNLENAILNKAILIEAQMERAELTRTKLVDASLQRANLTGAYLKEANLGGAHLENAILSGADLRGANLDKANLQNADLRNVDLTRASLQGTILNGAICNGTTRFPEGFDREGQGMQCQS